MNEDDLFIFDDDNLLLKRIANVYVCKKESFSVKNNLAICYLRDDLIYYKNGMFLEVHKDTPQATVKNPPLYDRVHLSGTEVRKRILEDGNWQELVAKSTIDVMEEINGVERIKNLSVKELSEL